MDYGPALGRRFRALKLWAVLRVFGREGLQRTIREHVRMAAEFERWIELGPGWDCAPAPVLGRVFPPGGLGCAERRLSRGPTPPAAGHSHTR